MSNMVLLTLMLSQFATNASAQSKWKHPSLPWIALGSSLAAGSFLYCMFISPEFNWFAPEIPPFSKGHFLTYTLPVSSVAFAASITGTFLFYRYVGSAKLWQSLLSGMAGGTAVAVVPFVLTDLTSKTVGRIVPKYEAVPYTYFWIMWLFPAPIGAFLGLTAGAVLHYALYRRTDE